MSVSLLKFKQHFSNCNIKMIIFAGMSTEKEDWSGLVCGVLVPSACLILILMFCLRKRLQSGRSGVQILRFFTFRVLMSLRF